MTPNETTNKAVREMLNDRVISVSFKKVNGEHRVMECTTNLQLIPPSAWPKESDKIIAEVSDDHVRVYDVKAQGWRSFNFKKLISIEEKQ